MVDSWLRQNEYESAWHVIGVTVNTKCRQSHYEPASMPVLRLSTFAFGLRRLLIATE